MNRVIEIEIAGESYPLNFSTKAARAVSDRYGDLTNIGQAFDDKTTVQALDELVWMLALLIEQGAAYHKIVNNLERKILTAEQLEIVLGVSDVVSLKENVMQAMTSGMSREVETEPEKNAQTTQGA